MKTILDQYVTRHKHEHIRVIMYYDADLGGYAVKPLVWRGSAMALFHRRADAYRALRRIGFSHVVNGVWQREGDPEQLAA